MFELLRRRTAVVHDPNREDDIRVKPTSGSYDAWARHCRTVDSTRLYYRYSFQLNDVSSRDDDVPSEAESAPYCYHVCVFGASQGRGAAIRAIFLPVDGESLRSTARVKYRVKIRPFEAPIFQFEMRRSDARAGR